MQLGLLLEARYLSSWPNRASRPNRSFRSFGLGLPRRGAPAERLAQLADGIVVDGHETVKGTSAGPAGGHL